MAYRDDQEVERHWPLGTKQRLVFDVFLYVGLRRGDAARLGKRRIRNGIVSSDDRKERGQDAYLRAGQPGAGGLDGGEPLARPRDHLPRTTARTTARKVWQQLQRGGKRPELR